jgi:hypothetical protein
MDKTPTRILTILLCLRALPGVGLGQTRDGLLGHQWGTPVAIVAEKVQLESPRSDGDMLMYTTALNSIGDVKIDQCDLEFVSGRLAGVIVTTSSEENSRRLLALLKKEYGEGQSNHPRARTWITPNTRVTYDEDSHGDAYIYWYSMLLQR